MRRGRRTFESIGLSNSRQNQLLKEEATSKNCIRMSFPHLISMNTLYSTKVRQFVLQTTNNKHIKKIKRTNLYAQKDILRGALHSRQI